MKRVTELIADSEWGNMSVINDGDSCGILSAVYKMGQKIKDKEQQKDDVLQKLNLALDEIKTLEGFCRFAPTAKKIVMTKEAGILLSITSLSIQIPSLAMVSVLTVPKLTTQSSKFTTNNNVKLHLASGRYTICTT